MAHSTFIQCINIEKVILSKSKIHREDISVHVEIGGVERIKVFVDSRATYNIIDSVCIETKSIKDKVDQKSAKKAIWMWV